MFNPHVSKICTVYWLVVFRWSTIQVTKTKAKAKTKKKTKKTTKKEEETNNQKETKEIQKYVI